MISVLVQLARKINFAAAVWIIVFSGSPRSSFHSLILNKYADAGVFGVILSPLLGWSLDIWYPAANAAALMQAVIYSIIPVWLRVIMGASVKSTTSPR